MINKNESVNALEKALELAGSEAKLAKIVGLTQQAISHWVRWGYVPLRHVITIERALGGRIKRHELRPDFFVKS